jgi:hypothetical protein
MSLGFHRVALWLIVAGIRVSLACSTGLAAASPTPPGGAIQVTGASADELEKNVRNQLFDPSKTNVRISVSNQQATSYLNLRTSSIPLEKPQVWFTQGKIFIRGTFTFICLYHPDVLIIAAPGVKDKKIVANIEQIYAGDFALPKDWIATVSQSLTDSIAEAQINLNFDRLDVLAGELVISGSKRAN